jgi:hypothetical protein
MSSRRQPSETMVLFGVLPAVFLLCNEVLVISVFVVWCFLFASLPVDYARDFVPRVLPCP